MTPEQFFFTLFAVSAVAGAIGVLAVKNPVNSAISLVGCFFALAGIYILLQAHFLAVLQILVYAGAIMVLFLFVLMLLNIRDDEIGRPRVQLTRLFAVCALGGIGLVLAATLTGSPAAGASVVATTIPHEWGQVASLGHLLMTRWVLPFEMVAVLLLAGIVSSVVIAKRRI